MSRLNKATREYIVSKALEKAGIPEQEVQLANDRFAWANKMRVAANGVNDDVLEALEAQRKALVAKIPKQLQTGHKLISERTYCYPNIGGLRVGMQTFAPEGDENPYRFCAYEPTLPASHPLADEFYTLQEREQELKSRKKVIAAQVSAVVDGVTTLKKLLEIWPEARELLPPNEQPIISNVPAVLITGLNAAIGLPTEEAST